MSQSSGATPELLAPAGGMDSLRAAVANGSDAVYLGLDRFNARRGAENFSLDSLEEACRFAHLRGTSVYLTLNVVILPDEMDDAVELVAQAWGRGIDAVIVQDLGLLRCLRHVLPQVRIHASTQLNTHSSAALEVLAGLGVSRVTLAREVSTGRIGRIVQAGVERDVEVESFVHGALCVCYSGQCLMSSLIGGRSANRGRCAQPCRLPYELLGPDDEVLADVGDYLLSPKDLAGIAVLPRLIDSGVAALKIEGRVKSAEYVALVTGVYRSALDRAASAPESFEVRDGEWRVLSEAFSRGFSSAYLVGERGTDMMSHRRPNNRGVPVGRITESDGVSAVIDITTDLSQDDTIEVWTSRGRFAQRVGEITAAGVRMVTASAPSRIRIEFAEPVGAGDRVFRVRNAALSAAAERTYADESAPVIPVSVAVEARIGEPLAVRIVDGQGRMGHAEGGIVEAARTKPLTVDEVVEHVGRFGGTPYRPESWDVTISPGAGMGFSALHAVRRDAVGDYERGVLGPWLDRHDVSPRAELPPLARRANRSRERDVELVAAVSDLEAADIALEAGVDRVIVPTWALTAGAGPVDGVTPYLSRIATDSQVEAACAVAASYGTACAGNLGYFAALNGTGRALEAHWSLNACNAHAVATLSSLGAALVWLSPELERGALARLLPATDTRTGVALAGRQELMVTEHCVLMAQGACDRVCERCPRRAVPTQLRDRKGYLFPVMTDPTGRSHIYNAVPLDVSQDLADLMAMGVRSFRLDLESESAHHVRAMVRAARSAVDGATRGRAVGRIVEGRSTTGHLHRGVD